jgi:hypothetical protein
MSTSKNENSMPWQLRFLLLPIYSYHMRPKQPASRPISHLSPNELLELMS